MAALCYDPGALDLEAFNTVGHQGQQTLTSVSSCTLTAAAAATLCAGSRKFYQKNLPTTSSDEKEDEHVTYFNLDRGSKLKPVAKSAHVIDFYLDSDKSESDCSHDLDNEKPTLAETTLPWKRGAELQSEEVQAAAPPRRHSMATLRSKGQPHQNGGADDAPLPPVSAAPPPLRQQLSTGSSGHEKMRRLPPTACRRTRRDSIDPMINGDSEEDLDQPRKPLFTVGHDSDDSEEADMTHGAVNGAVAEAECSSPLAETSVAHLPPPWSVDNSGCGASATPVDWSDVEPSPSVRVFSRMSLASDMAISSHRSDWVHNTSSNRQLGACGGNNGSSQAFCDLRSERPDSVRRRRCANHAYELARQRRLGTEDHELEPEQDGSVMLKRRVNAWLQRQSFLCSEAKQEYDLSVLLTEELVAIGRLPSAEDSCNNDVDDLEFAAFGPMPACSSIVTAVVAADHDPHELPESCA